MMTIQRSPSLGATRGFSLLEVLVATTILTSITLIAVGFLATAGDLTANEMVRTSVELRGTNFGGMTASDLADGWVIAPQSGPDESGIASSFIRVQQPADLNGDGSMLDEIAADDMYGVSAPWGDENGWFEYAFVPGFNADGSPDIVSEEVHGDINGDNDAVDVFRRGTIGKRWQGNDSGTSREVTVLSSVLQVETSEGVYGGCIDGVAIDGAPTPDPLFRMAEGSNVLHISAWMFMLDERANPFLHNVKTSICLRNHQP